MLKAAFFNQQSGFLDAIVRINKSTLLKHHQFLSLAECSSLEDVRTLLQSSSGYEGKHLEEMVGTLTPRSIFEACIKQLIDEIEFFRKEADSCGANTLLKFIEFFQLSFMIENASLLMSFSTGSASNAPASEVSHQEITEKCHPLGMFDSLLLLNAPEAVIQDIYADILLESPLARYLQQLSGQLDDAWYFAGRENMQVFVNTLYSLYWQDFYKFCQAELDGYALVVMKEYIECECDLQCINIAYSTMHLEGIPSEKQRKMFPSCCSFTPQAIEALMQARNWEDMRTQFAMLPQYKDFSSAPELTKEQVERALWSKQLACLEQSFNDSFSCAPFFAYCKLKEREVQNIVWICQCIAQHLPKDLYLKNCIEASM